MRQPLIEMKYRLDSVRKNRTRLRRKFIATPPKRRKPVARKRTINWLPLLFVFVAWLSLLLGMIYLAFLGNEIQKMRVEYRPWEELYDPSIPLIPPLSKEEKPKPRILGKETKDCYTARRGAHYYTECK